MTPKWLLPIITYTTEFDCDGIEQAIKHTLSANEKANLNKMLKRLSSELQIPAKKAKKHPDGKSLPTSKEMFVNLILPHSIPNSISFYRRFGVKLMDHKSIITLYRGR